MKNILKTCFVIIGTLIGAGFASGKEIYVFFNAYGILGFLGLFVANGIIALIIYLVFNIIKNEKISSHEDLTKKLIKNKKILTQVINNIINIFLLISFFVMVAGFGAYFKQEYNIPIFYGAIIISFCSYIIFLKSINGIIKINEILIPIVLIFIISLGFKCDINFEIIKTCYFDKDCTWIIKSILYASYNSIIIIPILIGLKECVKERRDIKKISILVFTISSVLSIVLYLTLQNYLEEIKELEIPVLKIASAFGKGYKNLYSITILIAIFTTATAAGYSFLNNICKSKKTYKIVAIFISVLAIFVSNIGFSNLLNLLYPILGYLGIGEIILICRHAIKKE